MDFIDASLRYRPTTELVLKNLNFTVQPGTKIGVVGRTGAGKSTICLSLSRIVELCGGRIEIDGMNIRKVDLQLLRRRVTVISQDPTLFKGSLRFNLDPFRKLSDSAIESLLIRAGLQDILNREVEGEDDKESEVYQDDETSRADSVISAEKEVANIVPMRTGSAASTNKRVKGIYF